MKAAATITRCAVFALALTAFAPEQGKVVPFCGFSTKEGWGYRSKTEYVTRRATLDDGSGLIEVVDGIKNVISIDVDFEVFEAEAEDNAYAMISRDGRRMLVIDVGFLEVVNQQCGSDWGAIQIIAHEVGHHLAGFNADSHKGELDADYWSGYVLQKLGAARSAAIKAIMYYGSDVDSDSHPNRTKRARTIEEGWDDAAAGTINFDHCQDCR